MSRLKVELINELADIIETLEPENGFSQNVWGRSELDSTGTACGTTACVAGWAALKMGDRLHVKPEWYGRVLRSMEIRDTHETLEGHLRIGRELGFTDSESWAIFGSTQSSSTRAFYGDYLDANESEAQRAARRLREFACSESLDPDDPLLKRNSPEEPPA